MDLKIPIDDQFSKLHPSLPLSTRIGIVGAGPSGLSAAYALSRLGYNNVTVLEKHHTVAGMCESVEIEGKIYDLGGQVLAANSAPVIFHLAKETGSELEEMDSHKLALIDPCSGKFQDVNVADDYVSVMTLTLDIQEKVKNSKHFGIHAVSQVASDLTTDYLESHGLKSVPKSVAYGYTASGFGFVQDLPYAYIHEFTRTSMAGKIRRFKGGYTSLWKKIAESLPIKLHCNTQVLAIRRSSESVKVTVKRLNENEKTMEFDKIIISGNFPLRYGRTYGSVPSAFTESEEEVMDATELERDLFSKVETFDYYTTVFKIKGFEHLPIGFFYFGEYMEDPNTIGNPVAMQKFYDDSDIFLFWSYGNSSDIKGPTVIELAIKAVESMGGKIDKFILQRRFKYFPHVNSQDMKSGFYEKLESELQGSRNTYYVGGLMAFELTERNSSYAMALMCKNFATSSDLPMFPYTKSLFPLQTEFQKKEPRELGELPGVQFPNLPSLNSYLKHWGTHPITQNRTLYSWINEEGEVVCKRSYGEQNSNASCIAQNLLTCRKPIIKPGDKVLLVYVPGLDFVDAFFGCIRAKVIPVPVLPPDPMQKSGQALVKIDNIAKSCGIVAILSTKGYHSAVRAGFVKGLISLSGKDGKSSARWPNLPWMHTDSWIDNKSKSLACEYVDDQCEAQPGDICFLQFTSGSTGDAKGVMITHGGLIHNVKLMRGRYKSTSRTMLISWLPQYHDMGLIGGLFTALVSGGSAVLFSPITFIKKPLLWLETMSKYQATHSAAPNFAFELVIRRLESNTDNLQHLDLSSMIFLMIAAEPVRQKTLKRFLELTGPIGLSQKVLAPGYGLAENCVFVSCAFGQGNPILVDWQGRICCGYVQPGDADVDIRIVDPESGEELQEDGKEGEIWISSQSSGIGYWGKDELSQKTFRNELPNHPGRNFTRTGDLGRIIDRKLFITGRIKDLIIAAGRNIYSSDVEKTVENSSEYLRPGCCAVIGVPEEILSAKGIALPDGSDQVGLVVIAEVRDGKSVSKDMIEHIQTRVIEEHGVSVASVKLIKPRTISKTTSGKIKRFECLKQFADETLNLVPQPLLTKKKLVRSFTTGTCKDGRTPRSNNVAKNNLGTSQRITNREIVEFLKKLISEQAGIPESDISVTDNITSYGVDSIGVVKATQKLSDFLGVPVAAIDVFTTSCIQELANFSENLLLKSKPQLVSNPSNASEEDIEIAEVVMDVSKTRQWGIRLLQLLALFYITLMLVFPAYISITAFLSFNQSISALVEGISWSNYLISLTLAPLSWILCIVSTSICISIFGNSFLRPNYALVPEVSIYSMDFIKWWTHYKTQEIASRVLAVHLRGTTFLKYWFEMLGARIGSSVLLDTVDITDPSLVSIGDEAVIGEGVLVQSHEVKNRILSFNPIRIGKSSSVGPYAVIQKGSVIKDGAEVQPLQKVEKGQHVLKPTKLNNVKESATMLITTDKNEPSAIYQLMGIYIVGFVSALAAAITYFLYTRLFQKPTSFQHFSFMCISGAFHWIPFTIIAYATMLSEFPSSAIVFTISLACAYLLHGLILSILTCIFIRLLHCQKQNHFKTWLRNQLSLSCHLRFAKLLTGTEAFCVYLRLLGAKIGKHCSIRAINPVSNPELMAIGNGVHLGDFSRIITGFHYSNGYTCGKIEVQDNSVVGSQSIILPGSHVEKNVILGALSIAPMNSILHEGSMYIGSQTRVITKKPTSGLDERIEEMDMAYKKVVSNLSANLATTTMNAKARYFHRIGVSGKGYLKMYDKIDGIPMHKIFHPGKSYPILIRHSNSLSADDDARIDARGASLKILSDEPGSNNALFDLTLKTGKAFYARTLADFASWFVCGLAAREELVKKFPHLREAVWNSLRNANSYAELHYYSNICRLLRFNDGQEMYVKFKLRPYDKSIGENTGMVKPLGILPPETGAIPRDENDKRPLLFLADDFKNRVSSPGGVHYVFQIQVRPVPDDEATRDVALDCTRPWDENDFPYIDVGEINITENLSKEESDMCEFNPYLKSHELDVIPATSNSQSASMDHGRSLIYEICQYVRNKRPLPESWRNLIEQSVVKVDLSCCPMAAAAAAAASLPKKQPQKVTLARTWYQTFSALFIQPFLQTVLPHAVIGLSIYAPLCCIVYIKNANGFPLHWMLPIFWILSGVMAALACVIAKWILVGRRKVGETMPLWSIRIIMDSTWQAIRTLIGDYFMDMTSGSFLFMVWMKMMGASIDIMDDGVYIDSSMGSLLNPEMVKIEGGGCVGREALLFGHIYEGDEGGIVKFGEIKIGEDGFVGSRAVVMPGVHVENEGNLSALTLAMKGEIIRSR